MFGAWFALPVDEWLKIFSHWIEGLGVWGYLLFIGVYVLACLLLAPGAPLSSAAGLIFGLARGFVVVLIGATIGALLAFLVARYLVRDKVRSSLEGKPKFAAVEKAISEDGWKVVLLLRLSPLVPFNLQNYFFGVSEVKFWPYAASTFFGIMPGAQSETEVRALAAMRKLDFKASLAIVDMMKALAWNHQLNLKRKTPYSR